MTRAKWGRALPGFLILVGVSACDDWLPSGSSSNHRVKREIGAEGGIVELRGVARAEFPAGAFPTSQTVSLERIESDSLSKLFEETATIFDPAENISYQVVVNTGKVQPQSDLFAVVLRIPDGFHSTVPADHGVEAFLLLRQEGGNGGEVLDTWELVPSEYDPSEKTLRVWIPSFVLSPTFSDDETNEVALTIAATPGSRQPVASARQSIALAARAAACAAPVASPLDVLDIMEGFGELRRNADKKGPYYRLHWGVDLRAPVGTPVKAAASGTVHRRGWINGYGNTIILKHGVVHTLYAHLSAFGSGTEVGKTVTEGQLIGQTGRTGIPPAYEAHLHFEIAPRGDIMQNKNKADPFGCIPSEAEGDILLRDNGTLTDDAFVVYIDDREIIRTTRGGSSEKQTGPLRIGDHNLRLVCLEAPDNVGTYEVLLSNRTVFKRGDQRRRSGTLPQGGERQDSIVVYATDDKSILVGQLSRPNTVIELRPE